MRITSCPVSCNLSTLISVRDTAPTLNTPFFETTDPVVQWIVTLPSFLISFPPAHVHVSPRLDSGVSSTFKCGTRFLLVTHSTAPLSTTASSLIHLPFSLSSNTYISVPPYRHRHFDQIPIYQHLELVAQRNTMILSLLLQRDHFSTRAGLPASLHPLRRHCSLCHPSRHLGNVPRCRNEDLLQSLQRLIVSTRHFQ